MENNEPSYDFYYDGENLAFWGNGAGFAEANPLNFIQGATSIRSHATENPGEDYRDVVFTCNNFGQDLGFADTFYTNHRDRMSSMITHWTSTLGQTPIFWLQEVIPEGQANLLSSRDELDALFLAPGLIRHGSQLFCLTFRLYNLLLISDWLLCRPTLSTQYKVLH
jgi:hypothetical protein